MSSLPVLSLNNIQRKSDPPTITVDNTRKSNPIKEENESSSDDDDLNPDMRFDFGYFRQKEEIR